MHPKARGGIVWILVSEEFLSYEQPQGRSKIEIKVAILVNKFSSIRDLPLNGSFPRALRTIQKIK